MKIAHVSSEVAPWSQTGGLAEVLGSLPPALERAGARCAVFSPLYRTARERVHSAGAALEDTGVEVSVALGDSAHGAERPWPARLWRVRGPDAPPVYFVDTPELFDRDGLYMDERGRDHGDNHLRFALLCRAALEAAPRLMGGVPDVFHAHDWHAGLVPVYLRTRYAPSHGRAAALFTIHNLAYQGVFAKDALPALGLDWPVFTPERMEFFDRVSFLKGGVAYADGVTTVSPTYAREVCTPQAGHGLDGFLRHHARNLQGILNGIDTASWDPARDAALAASYDAGTIDTGKPRCRRDLAEHFGLELDDGDILLGVVSRFAWQKGMDIIAELVPELYRLGARLVVLGSGAADLEDRFRYLARAFSRHVAARVAFDGALARRIISGADALLVPSRFEPCGLVQLYAMRYGTVPIVHAVGGLRDTVHDPGDDALARGQGTGFCFEEPTAAGLHRAVDRAARMFRDHPRGWRAICRAGMRCDFSWDRSAREYMRLYRRVTQQADHATR